ncbi:hypothetical protein MMC17_007875 [Xylographa soralifera]|nr:hypothetical protein [Xylographa soralifera]
MFLDSISSHAAAAIFLVPFTIILYLLYDYMSKPDLREIPGPFFFAVTRYRLALEAWKAHSVQTIHVLHLRYGPVVRIGPNEVSFNSLSALRQIYGAGSAFERTTFYSMFDVYGRPNLFTFTSGKDHRARKKLLSHAYSNQAIMNPTVVAMVQQKAAAFLDMVQREPGVACEIFASLHYFAIDTISEFVYGPKFGGTKALTSGRHRELLDDILDHSRRRLSWSAVHFPALTKWLTSRTGMLDNIITRLGLLPMNRPFTYTGIRVHALAAFKSFKYTSADIQAKYAESTVIGRLYKVQKSEGLSDMDIASECADHLLAGIDTTADSLLFLIWTVARPQNRAIQTKLRAELASVPADARGISAPKDLAKLPYLNAVVRETLRVYAPLPGFEPRTSPIATVIDGYRIPAHTVVGMSPYCLHRATSIFPDPLTFDPERWLTKSGDHIPESDLRNRWFWAFSSGARMCIGMHLANVEMVTLTAAVFRRYQAVAKEPDVSPGISSRYEIFGDETVGEIVEHKCLVDFVPVV